MTNDDQSRQPAIAAKPVSRSPSENPSPNTSPATASLGDTVRLWLAAQDPRAPVIIVPVSDTRDVLMETLGSVIATRVQTTPLLILDGRAGDPLIASALMSLAQKDGSILFVQAFDGESGVRRLDTALAWCAPRDVVVLASDTIVGDGWLERLHTAAYARTNVATATPFSNDATFLSVPYRNIPTTFIPRGMTLAQADASIRDAARGAYPTIPAPVEHCVYYRRDALAVVGALDPSFAPHCGAETDWAQRAVSAGFSHVAADTLFVFSRGRRVARDRRTEQEVQEGSRTLATRYPWYKAWLDESARNPRTPLAQSLQRARIALMGPRVAIDARSLRDTTMGTQIVTIELIRALANLREESTHLTVVLEDGVSSRVLDGLDRYVDAVIRTADLRGMVTPTFDIMHRPYQIPEMDDLQLLRRVASRLIFTHLDSIFFANPSYVADETSWLHVRQTMHRAFTVADGIAFLSKDAMLDAERYGLTAPAERIKVTYSGVDHRLLSAEGERPDRLAALGDVPFLLVIGTNYRHKNRHYAIALLQELIRRYNWPGKLVFAGVAVPYGTSGGTEAEARLADPALHLRIHDIGAASEQEKRWLYERAALVLYPSVVEGFGLVPFEAASVNTPALTARTTSVAEVLGDEVAYLDGFAAEESVEIVWSLLSDQSQARRQVELIATRARSFTWAEVADNVLDLYRRVLALPPRMPSIEFGGDLLSDSSELQRDVQVAQREIHETQQRIVAATEHFRVLREDTVAAYRVAEARERDLAEVRQDAARAWEFVEARERDLTEVRQDAARAWEFATVRTRDVEELRDEAIRAWTVADARARDAETLRGELAAVRERKGLHAE